ncbi:MAG: sigma-70 family RNA polymerase sigma factor [Chitinophagaceae bacterium]|nr:sigma-70 family RNA polymerase sigma factor [Chitinophagaceae bacterium]
MPENVSSPPTALVRRFEKIYSDTYYKLYGFVKHYVWDEDAIKDVLQECYVRLWQNMEKVQDDEKILPLLRTYAMHITIDVVRKTAKELKRAGIYHSRQSQPATADEGLHIQEAMRLYKEAVNALPPRQKMVFELVREKGLTYREISDQLNISTHTLKRHMNEALHTLRSRFPPEMLTMVWLFMSLHMH